MITNEIYKKICKNNIDRLLSLYDLEPFSDTYGYGDREYWGWKSRDYVNASTQGGALALAILLKIGCFKNYETKIVDIINSIIEAVDRIMYKNNSVDEILPYENCFCVSATLCLDILYTMEFIEDHLLVEHRTKYLAICKALISFFSNNIETHGIISNHLASAVAAIYKYSSITKDTSFNDCADKMLDKIITNQSEEGWYMEYEGADLGYQTLCTYYLAIAYKNTNNYELLNSLNKSIDFLAYFIHPDGSLGGEYGSRNTQIYYPAGFEILANDNSKANKIARFMRNSINNKSVITINAVDSGNFVPYINNYLMAFVFSQKNTSSNEYINLPFEEEVFTRGFNHSGLIVVNKASYYAVISTYKGGTIKVFDKTQNTLILDDCGYIGKIKNNRFTSQIIDSKVQYKYDNNKLKLSKQFNKVSQNLPSPLKFIILRLMNVSIMRMKYFNKLIKNMLVKLLITYKAKIPIDMERHISFEDKTIRIKDKLTNNTGKSIEWISYGKKFTCTHMASSKYYNKHYLLENKFYCDIDIERFNRDKYYELENIINIEGK